MSRPFITVGDKTSHGGTVISGDAGFLLHGKLVARVGDMTVCPKCKGTFPISSGTSDMTSTGQAPAREGDRTACGATLIASQGISTHAEQSAAGGSAPASGGGAEALASTAVAAPTDSGICISCLMKAAKSGAAFVVRD